MDNCYIVCTPTNGAYGFVYDYKHHDKHPGPGTTNPDRWYLWLEDTFTVCEVKCWTRLNFRSSWCKGDTVEIPTEDSGLPYVVIYEEVPVEIGLYVLVPHVQNFVGSSLPISAKYLPDGGQLFADNPLYNIDSQRVYDCAMAADSSAGMPYIDKAQKVVAIGIGGDGYVHFINSVGFNRQVSMPGVRDWKRYLVVLQNGDVIDVVGIQGKCQSKSVIWRDGQAYCGDTRLHGLQSGTDTVQLPSALIDSYTFEDIICLLPDGGTLAEKFTVEEPPVSNTDLFKKNFMRDLEQWDSSRLREEWEELVKNCPPSMKSEDIPFSTMMRFLHTIVNR